MRLAYGGMGRAGVLLLVLLGGCSTRHALARGFLECEQVKETQYASGWYVQGCGRDGWCEPGPHDWQCRSMDAVKGRAMSEFRKLTGCSEQLQKVERVGERSPAEPELRVDGCGLRMTCVPAPPEGMACEGLVSAPAPNAPL
jgi:hypothetical protein